MHTYMHVYMYLSICLVPPQNPPFLHFCNFSCHFWLPSKYLELAINCKMCRIEDFQKNFFNPGLDWRLKILRKTSSIQVWIEDWRLKILRKTSSIQVWLHIFNPGLDWRSFSENLQSSIQDWTEEVFLRIFIQSSTQTWIEEVFLRIFNLQSDTFCN